MDNPFMDDISEEENMDSSESNHPDDQSKLKEPDLKIPEKEAERSIRVIEILPAERQTAAWAEYSKKCSLAYMDYLEHEKFLGSTEIWSIQQFYKLVWLLTGFE
jgi:hypothetical protein